jgi:hypothetical protein
MIELKEETYQAPGGIAHTYLFPVEGGTVNYDILIVSFSGTYPRGSSGNAHGQYISIMTMFGLHTFDPMCIILDLRDLAYTWGNTLLKVFQDVSQFMDDPREPGAVPFPILAVTSDKCRDAFLSLITPLEGTPTKLHFEDIEAAIEAAKAEGQRWLDS